MQSLCQPWEGRKQPLAGFLSVLRAFCIYWVRERAVVQRSASNSILIFSLYVFP